MQNGLQSNVDTKINIEHIVTFTGKTRPLKYCRTGKICNTDNSQIREAGSFPIGKFLELLSIFCEFPDFPEKCENLLNAKFSCFAVKALERFYYITAFWCRLHESLGEY